MELNLFMYFLHYSQTAQHFNFIRRLGGGALSLKKKNYVFWVVLTILMVPNLIGSIQQKRFKGSQSFAPLSAFFFCETLIQSISNLTYYLSNNLT